MLYQPFFVTGIYDKGVRFDLLADPIFKVVSTPQIAIEDPPGLNTRFTSSAAFLAVFIGT
jgi:hypothetical protein